MIIIVLVVTWDFAEVLQRDGGEHPVPGLQVGGAAGQAPLQPRDEGRERGELHVRVRVLERRRRQGPAQPTRCCQARRHQAGVGRGQAPGQRREERPPPAAEEHRRHVLQPRLVLGSFRLLFTARDENTSTLSRVSSDFRNR